MLTLQQIKADPDYIVRRLAVKGFEAREVIDRPSMRCLPSMSAAVSSSSKATHVPQS